MPKLPRELTAERRQMLYSIGRQIASARVRLGMTQADLGKAVKLNQNSISRVEKGGVDLTVVMLTEFANALGVPFETLLEPVPRSLNEAPAEYRADAPKKAPPSTSRGKTKAD